MFFQPVKCTAKDAGTPTSPSKRLLGIHGEQLVGDIPKLSAEKPEQSREPLSIGKPMASQAIQVASSIQPRIIRYATEELDTGTLKVHPDVRVVQIPITPNPPAEAEVSLVPEKAPSSPTPTAPPATQPFSPPPPPPTELTLWLRYVATPPGTPERAQLRQQLILRYAPDAERMASIYYRTRMPSYSLIDREDLVQAACMGMASTIDDYNPRYGDGKMTFIKFARFRIAGAMIDCLRDMQDCTRLISKHRRELRPKIEAIRQRYAAKHGHRMSRDELIDAVAKELGVEAARIVQDPLFDSFVFNQRPGGSSGSSSPGSSDNASGDGDESAMLSMAHVTDNRDSTPVSARMERSAVMDKILGVLTNRDERLIVLAYYYMEMTNKEISRLFTPPVSLSTTVSRRKLALEKLRQHFGTSEELKKAMSMMK